MDDRLVASPPVWVLTLDVFGARHLIASEDVTITDSRGFVRVFQAGLVETTISKALGTLGNAPTGEPTATLTGLYLPGSLQRSGQGAEIVIGQGELAVHARGTAWELRQVLVSGRVREWRVRRGDYVDVSIGDQLGDDRGTLLPPSAVVNSQTWPAHVDSVSDQGYPIVFGEPGVFTYASGATGSTTGSPALMVDGTGAAEVILVSMGRVQAQNVTIRNEDDASEQSFAVSTTVDGLGQVVSVVDLSTPGALTIDTEAVYHARWDGGGGIYADDGTLLAGAGAVLFWALRHSTVPVDFAAIEAVKHLLDGYILAGYVNDSGFSPIDWIADNLLPILPISLVFGAGGLAPVVHRTDYALSDIELTLSEDEPGSEVRITDDGIGSFGLGASAFRLVFAWSVLQERGRRERTITGDPAQIALEASSIKPDLLCIRAHELLTQSSDAAPSISEVQTRVVYDEATARRILNNFAAHQAIPPREVSLDVGWPVAARLRLGQIVQVRSRDYYIDRPGRVAELTYSIEGARVRVLLDAHPERDRYNQI